MDYTVVIRTLGTAGDYYQRTLDSLLEQSIKPQAVIIYIAGGYPIPKETIGIERYVYVKKGMVAQRALDYNEVNTQFILFLDDDVNLPSNGVETLYNELNEMQGDVISPCVFYNHKASIKSKIIRTLTGKEVCRLYNDKWAYKVLRTGGFSYNNKPVKPVYESTTNAGPCFFCKKEDFLKIHFEEELWLDDAPYALPEDQVMYYKMHLLGLKVLTSFDSGIIHLDAGSATVNTPDRIARLVYSEYRNKLIFWYRFIFCPEESLLKRIWAVVCLCYTIGIQTVKYTIKLLLGNVNLGNAFFRGVKDAVFYLSSKEYKPFNKYGA